MADNELTALRETINTLDDQILDLFVRRMQTAAGVAQYKRTHGLPVLNAAREREILTRMADRAGEGLEQYSQALFSTLFSVSRAYQRKLLGFGGALLEEIKASLDATAPLFPQKAVVACQGVEGAYSQQACNDLFPLPTTMYFTRFEGVFQAVEKGLCRYGILPIENSTHGSVTEVYDLMTKYHFHIVRSHKMRIRHVLVANPGAALSGIREIYSHEQAIGQCGEFLKSLKDVEVHICANTAEAAKMVAASGRTDIAAIASRACLELYGLVSLKESISDTEDNFTRFICIAKDMEIYPGADRISLMLSLTHKPGSLCELLARFSALGVNLAKIESRPMPGSDFEFVFYLDLEASVYREDVLSLLSDLAASQPQFTFLGAYRED
ncbi:MAG: prephenate dehydratase domain-containing protein [Eubacteriales bacterium]|nr:prephenate dehydratase domain-containing protein [Eubacteriales bacterium]